MAKKLVMTPANKDWDRIPGRYMGFIKNAIAMACKKHDCEPEDLEVRAVFDNGVLEMVRTKPLNPKSEKFSNWEAFKRWLRETYALYRTTF